MQPAQRGFPRFRCRICINNSRGTSTTAAVRQLERERLDAFSIFLKLRLWRILASTARAFELLSGKRHLRLNKILGASLAAEKTAVRWAPGCVGLLRLLPLAPLCLGALRLGGDSSSPPSSSDPLPPPLPSPSPLTSVAGSSSSCRAHQSHSCWQLMVD